MSIIAFWNDDKEQTGKTLTAVAVATKMAVERNMKILLITTSYRDATLKNCFWSDAIQNNFNILGKQRNNIALENGIDGLSKLLTSNKLEPSMITDYTKVVFKNRLEILSGYLTIDERLSEKENFENYKRVSECYPDLLRIANQYYDMVVVDVDNALSNEVKQEILRISNLKMVVLSQRMSSLNKYNEMKEQNKEIIGPAVIPVIGRYDRNSKYNQKNIVRYLKEKKNVGIVPYSTLFFEAAEEANVAEFFMKMGEIRDTNDGTYYFMAEMLNLIDMITNRLQELQMRMR
ncbi:MAG: hypothetical protein HFJ55_03975 [Clostridia bacterium]|nr:hypothetical protein [Clostridia bacterium]